MLKVFRTKKEIKTKINNCILNKKVNINMYYHRN